MNINITKKIILLFFTIFALSACDIAPDVVKERMFVDTANGGDQNMWVLRDVFQDSATGTTVHPALCAETKKLIEAKASSTEWLKQDKIDPNTGNPTGQKVGPITYIVDQIKQQMDKAVRKVFEAFAQDTIFKEVVMALVTITIAMYGLGIIVGTLPITPYQLAMITTKIAVILALVTSYDTFEEVVKNFFEGMVDGFIVIMSQTFSSSPIQDQLEVFEPVEEIFSKLFSMEFSIMMMALITTGWTGLFYGLAMLGSIIFFLIAVLRALYVYIVSMVARGFLYAVAPIFITLGVMKPTKSLFENWLQLLVSFTLQPILLFAFLAVFLEMIKAFLGVLYTPEVNATHVCYMEWFRLKGGDKVVYFWQFSTEQGISALKGVNPEISVDLIILFTFIILSIMMILFSTWAVDVAAHMAQGFISTALPSAPGWANIRQELITPLSEGAGGLRGFLTGESKDKFGYSKPGGFSEGAEAAKRTRPGARE